MNHSDILQQYSGVSLLQEGGQKAAYLVQHSEYGNAVVKIGTFTSPRSLERARREVMVLSEINSHYYPANYEFEVVSADTYVIVEEYIESQPLSQRLVGFGSVLDILEFTRHLVLGLMILWDKRIVHRDMKPDNILVASDGLPVIIDLGIARLLDLESLTRSYFRSGPCTPVYASPEQLTNRKTDIDARTDQFSLGIVTLQLLLDGLHPFDPNFVGRGESIVANILGGIWCDGIFSDGKYSPLESLIRRLLGGQPYQRYRLPTTLLADLDKCIEVYT